MILGGYIIALFVLCTIPIVDLLQCSRQHQFKHNLINSSVSFDFSSLKNESNKIGHERCFVRLEINYNNGLVNSMFRGGFNASTFKQNSSNGMKHVEEWFNSDNETFASYDALQIMTSFALDSDLKSGDLIYQCSMNDYCDIEFVREIFSTSLPTKYIDSFQKNITSRLYTKDNNNISVTCFDKLQCPNNAPFCSRSYSRNIGQSINSPEKHHGICVNNTAFSSVFRWYQVYTTSNKHQQINTLMYDCNTPNCGSNQTSNEIIKMLSTQYRLPYNNSIIHVIKPTSSPSPTTTTTTTTSTSRVTTTTTSDNYASNIIAHLYFTILCFSITIFFV